MPGMTPNANMNLHPIQINKPYDVLFTTGSTASGSFIYFMDDNHVAFITADRNKPTVLATYQYISQHGLSLLNGQHDNKHLAITDVTAIQKIETPRPPKSARRRTEAETEPSVSAD